MTSKITFSNIKYTLVKSSSDVTKTERTEGRLNARSIINRFSQNMRIDVLILKKGVTLDTGNSITFKEVDFRARKCFSTLTKNEVKNGKIPLHTAFFKKVQEGDTIIVILHEVKP